MALVTCTECRRQISSDAMTCPHCGAPGKAAGFTRSTSRHGLAWLVAIIVIAVALGLIVGKLAEAAT